LLQRRRNQARFLGEFPHRCPGEILALFDAPGDSLPETTATRDTAQEQIFPGVTGNSGGVHENLKRLSHLASTPLAFVRLYEYR
jgi:hypothetical protein